jgi:3-phenylpropionate/trans-cinnamate dioxygenase ferredoxin component
MSSEKWVQLCAVDAIEPGGREVFALDDEWIAVFNVQGEFYAIADMCTHDEGPLGDGALEGHVITCPRHGARFDIRTGQALTIAVAPVDVPRYDLRIVNNHLEILLTNRTPGSAQ